jgi:phosphopantothenoylcysteine decarboxylase/phosphopantothenate--cysteine ligase
MYEALTMTEPESIYLIVSGASSARCAPDLLGALTQFDLPILTVLTDAAHNIISPNNLAEQPDHTLVDSYFDPVLLDSRAPCLTVVAPATFNTLNKISLGIADTLAHSLIAEAIGANWPVIVAPSMNMALASHPQVTKSIKILREWGVKVLEPKLEDDLLMMASVPEIITAIKAALEETREES